MFSLHYCWRVLKFEWGNIRSRLLQVNAVLLARVLRELAKVFFYLFPFATVVLARILGMHVGKASRKAVTRNNFDDGLIERKGFIAA